MKDLLVSKLPKCDFCPNNAEYDTKLIGKSTWANLCIQHYGVYGTDQGTHVVLKEFKPWNGKPVMMGIDIIPINDIIVDLCDREIKCPECSAIKRLEIDAEGEYICSCGQKIMFEAMI